ncbi:MAG: DUF1553 domain-containing protein [Planctomycetes bacterium]|nr:DUF1553 domain-containing protein [Planctomycetota bacterium]
MSGVVRRLISAGPWAAMTLVFVSSSLAADKLEYNRTIRPILAENCFACHGPDSAARKADLRLDQREPAIKSGSLVPGDVDGSEIIRRILSTDPAEQMPPPSTKKSITPAQVELLKRWVAEGAEYQAHWSFLPPVKTAPPKVKNTGWIKNPIDNFILARLEAQGLTPAPEADRRTLARRLSLDLTGLPPDPADVEAFVNDKSADAYNRLVDHFLKSPQWGEHRARYWLDAARYADTHGIHFDNFREIWTYREWVIQAFNRNLPFDQFTIEQLAGDLLPNRTLDQTVASGFNRCNITTSEGGAIDEEYRVLYTRDRTETTSAVWLGLTANCAVCHDHKFDPLTMRDFYSMSAFFNNTTQGAMDGNIKDTPPTVFVPRVEDRENWDKLVAQAEETRRQIAVRRQTGRPEFDQWAAALTPEKLAGQVPADGLVLAAALNGGSGRTLPLTVAGQPREVTLANGFQWVDGRFGKKVFALEPGETITVPEVGDFENDQGFTFASWVKLTGNNPPGSILARMDNLNGHRGWDIWVEGNRIATHLVHKWPENALKVVSGRALPVDQWVHVTVTYDGSKQAGGVKIYFNGAGVEVQMPVNQLKDTIRTTVPLKIGQRETSERLTGLQLENLRLYQRALQPGEASSLARTDRILELAAKPVEQRSGPEKDELFEYWFNQVDQPAQELRTALSGVEQAQANLKGRGSIAHVMQEKGDPAMAFVLFRGEYDKRRDLVNPTTPAALPPFPADAPRNRLGFAQWLLQPENPLTARVTVNRFWQEVFGTGIVRTTGDFGVAGELPSHPELLDWLAIEFREQGWDVKQFFKLLVTSATYRQSAAATPEKIEKDPHNRWLARGPRFRMDAEMVRDNALASSGLLVRKLGGPSVRPYQPPGVWEAVAMIGSNTRDYKPDAGENLYRRSLYTFWKRSAPPALLDIFNAPSREVCTVRRERTNTPLQALATLNDPTFVESARKLAQEAILRGGNLTDDHLKFISLRLLSRPLSDAELRVVNGSLKELLAYYESHPEDAKQLVAVGDSPADPAVPATTLAAWTMLVNELMNLDEVLCK